MKKLIFLLEELSMKELLDILLPKIIPDGINFITIAHQGKSDLQNSIPRKLRSWREDNIRFVILHDKDSHDCITLKNELVELCQGSGRPDTLVRIVCTELESWFLGDLRAVEQAFNINNLSKKQTREKFRDPDLLGNASEELKKLAKNYQKLSGARSIAQYMDCSNNTSKSFNQFVTGIKRVIAEFNVNS